MSEDEEMVEKIKRQLEALRSKWVGSPLHFEEVVANTVFWGSILSRFYPEAVGAAQHLIDGMRLDGETFQREGGDKAKWN